MAATTTPHALARVRDDLVADRYPRSLLVAVTGWVLLGVLLILARGTGGHATSDAGQEAAADAAESSFGDGLPEPIVAPNDDVGALTSSLPWVGLAVLLAAAVLAAGVAWTRPLLAGLGVFGAVLLVAVSPLATAAALLLVVAASVCAMLPASHRYLRPRRAVDDGVPETGSALRQ